jgi:hypothetical protein
VAISSLGTLALAVATYASVRSSQEAARLNERSLMAGLRPVLAASRDGDGAERVMFGGGHWITVQGHGGVAEDVDDVLYLAMGLRNVGQGLAVLHGWLITPSDDISVDTLGHAASARLQPPAEHEFRRQTRDLYIAPGDSGFWQGAIRDPADPDYAALRASIAARDPVTIYLLYGDHEGGQRTISRFTIIDEAGELIASVSRYWNLDRDDPRE